MLPVPVRKEPDTRQQSRLAQREIILWTTKDGREIPLDEMSDDHIANAVRVLMLWRVRLKKRDPDNPVVRDLADAISRFKDIQRRRKKSVGGRAALLLEKPGRGKASDGKFGHYASRHQKVETEKPSAWRKKPDTQKSSIKGRGFPKARSMRSK